MKRAGGRGGRKGGYANVATLDEGALIMFCVSINIRKTVLIPFTASVMKVLKISTAASRERYLNCDNISTK